MAISFNFGAGSTDTPVNKALAPWKYADAIRTMSESSELAKMADILSPLDLQTIFKISNSRIANVYNTLAGGSVPVAEQSANTSGQSIFCELKTTCTRTEAVTSRRIQLPMVARIELRLPNDAAITEADITTLVMQAFACLCDEAGDPVVVTEKMRGALAPQGS